jgi:hypothetical protein
MLYVYDLGEEHIKQYPYIEIDGVIYPNSRYATIWRQPALFTQEDKDILEHAPLVPATEEQILTGTLAFEAGIQPGEDNNADDDNPVVYSDPYDTYEDIQRRRKIVTLHTSHPGLND